MLSKFLILFLVVFSGVFYYFLVEDEASYSEVFVIRVIDGDTFDSEIGRVRLKGINAPEEKMFLYEESKDFLASKIENKTIWLEGHSFDKYGRILAYVFYEEENVNEEILKNGLGSLYYYEEDEYYDKFRSAEEFARLNEKGIWKMSDNSSCIQLVKLVYFEGDERCTNNEQVILENICDFDIDVLIKDDATHIYREKLLANSLFLRNFSCIWNDEGDTVYVMNNDGLILFYRY
jgi:micrococcal nuclease